MANQVGSIAKLKDEANGVYFKGTLHLEAYAGPVFLVPAAKRVANSPDFIVKVCKNGTFIQYGSAWLGKMKGDDGAQYVSITIAAPGVGPIYVKAFPADDQPREVDAVGDVGTVYNVIWSPNRMATATGARNGAVRAGGAFDDTIPF